MLVTGGIVCYLRNINRFLPTLRRGKGGRNAAVDILPVSQRFLSGVVVKAFIRVEGSACLISVSCDTAASAVLAILIALVELHPRYKIGYTKGLVTIRLSAKYFCLNLILLTRYCAQYTTKI